MLDDKYSRFLLDEIIPGRLPLSAGRRSRRLGRSGLQLGGNLRVHRRLAPARQVSQGADPQRQLHQHQGWPRLPRSWFETRHRPSPFAFHCSAGRVTRRSAGKLVRSQWRDGTSADRERLSLPLSPRRRRPLPPSAGRGGLRRRAPLAVARLRP